MDNFWPPILRTDFVSEIIPLFRRTLQHEAAVEEALPPAVGCLLSCHICLRHASHHPLSWGGVSHSKVEALLGAHQGRRPGPGLIADWWVRFRDMDATEWIEDGVFGDNASCYMMLARGGGHEL